MTQEKRSLTSQLKTRTTVAILASALTVLPSISQAGIICEQGRINLLELGSGGGSKILISAEHGDAYSPKHVTQGMRATVIEYKDSDIRWRDRLAVLRSAFALQQPIKITANDGFDCIGLTDEFTINVCLPGKC